MTITRDRGGYSIEAYIENDGRFDVPYSFYPLIMHYYDYSRKESITRFKEYLEENHLKLV